MTPSLKHGILGFVCLIVASILFFAAIFCGAKLIAMLEVPILTLLNTVVEKAGDVPPRDILQPNVFAQTRIAFIVAVIAAAAGVGLAKAIGEFSKVIFTKKPVQSNNSSDRK